MMIPETDGDGRQRRPHPTYPYTAAVGYDLRDDLGKEQWIALTVDLIRASLGEDADTDAIRAEIVDRIDVLHGNGIVPRTLPKSRYPRREAV